MGSRTSCTAVSFAGASFFSSMWEFHVGESIDRESRPPRAIARVLQAVGGRGRMALPDAVSMPRGGGRIHPRAAPGTGSARKARGFQHCCALSGDAERARGPGPGVGAPGPASGSLFPGIKSPSACFQPSVLELSESGSRPRRKGGGGRDSGSGPVHALLFRAQFAGRGSRSRRTKRFYLTYWDSSFGPLVRLPLSGRLNRSAARPGPGAWGRSLRGRGGEVTGARGPARSAGPAAARAGSRGIRQGPQRTATLVCNFRRWHSRSQGPGRPARATHH